jgi:hypothetical protein
MLSFCQRACIRAGNVIEDGAILALDTLFLAGKLLPSEVPEKVTQAALFGLSASSIIGFPFQCHVIKKTVEDLKHSFKTGERTVLAATTVKTAYVAASLLLGAGNFVAAIFGLFDQTTIQSDIYKAMIPAGWVTIGLGATTTLSYLYFFHKVLKQSPQLQEAALRFLERSSLEEGLENDREVMLLASDIRYCMDKDTLRDLLDNYDPEMGQIFREQVIKNIQTQRNIAAGGRIFLSMIGYGLMAAEKWFTPNSVEAAVINEVMALAYLADTTTHLCCEVPQRNAIERTSSLLNINREPQGNS